MKKKSKKSLDVDNSKEEQIKTTVTQPAPSSKQSPDDIKADAERIAELFKETIRKNMAESRAREDKRYGISGNRMIKDNNVQKQKQNDINRQQKN